MKNKLYTFNRIVLILFLLFFIYENIALLSLMKSENINMIYPYHNEIFYNRIIRYELEVSTYTNFTISCVFKIIFNFIQAIGIIEILYFMLSIPIYLNNEKSNSFSKIYISIINVFLIKILICIICFLLAYLTYTIEISIAWIIIKCLFILSIIYYTIILCKLILID